MLYEVIMSFQSRLGKDPWIKPYTDATIVKLAESGTKNLLVVSPSFVADCLETTLEIGEQYRDLFHAKGGSDFNFTESLNAKDAWVQTIYDLLCRELKKNKTSLSIKTQRNITDLSAINSN